MLISAAVDRREQRATARTDERLGKRSFDGAIVARTRVGALTVR